jgi:hypothetical protein
MKALSLKNLTGFFAAVMGVALVGCADGVDFTDSRAVQARDAKALEDLYTGVRGTWEGTVSNPATGLKPFHGELKLYVIYVQDGVNADGSPKLRPTLRGRFQPRDFDTETDAMELGGDFDRTGRLLLVAQRSLVGGAAAEVRTLVVRGSIESGVATLELTRQGGVWGVLQARRTSSDASAPATGLERELRERALRRYRAIEGSYVGVVKTVDGNDYRGEIVLTIVERAGFVHPILRAQYKRLDDRIGNFEWSMSVSYDSQTREIFMREDQSTGSRVPDGWLLSITGVVTDVASDRVINATITNRLGVIGTVSAVRKK